VKKLIFKVVLELAQEGGYVIYVPSLPGCISEGDSKEEALENIKEAIELYLEPTENPVLANSAEVAEVAV
jgi:predicted RNase H-like HicB family nuclease